MASKQRRLAKTVVGFVRRLASIEECQKLGAVDHATLSLQEAITGADLVVLCTPIAQMRMRVEEMLPFLQRGAIVTDVGIVKSSVVRELEPIVARAGARFVGSHPMAGAEKTGVASARADLFVNAVCVVTQTSKSNKVAMRHVEEFWQALGGRILRLTPEMHDMFVSRTSHLPHVVASALANYVLNPAHPKKQAALCANGFRDTTRIASGSPEMWRDIALANRKNLAVALAAFIRDLQKFRRMLQNAEQENIKKFFETAKQRRDCWCTRAVSPSPE